MEKAVAFMLIKVFLLQNLSFTEIRDERDGTLDSGFMQLVTGGATQIST
jgi:hypothetical protein